MLVSDPDPHLLGDRKVLVLQLCTRLGKYFFQSKSLEALDGFFFAGTLHHQATLLQGSQRGPLFFLFAILSVHCPKYPCILCALCLSSSALAPS